MKLHGKVAIITGASSGIGRSAARLFAQEGAAVVLGARTAGPLETICQSIQAAGGQAICLAGDIRDDIYAEALVTKAVETFGGLDIGFNNAATLGQGGLVCEMAPDDWRLVLSTNLDSAFHAARHQIPAIRARGGGSLIFTSSFVGHTIGLPGMGAYAASKAGLIGLTQVLAVEHGTDNIRVNALLPGGTRTGMLSDEPGVEDYVASLHALKRVAEPEEIARAALFLASADSSFVTGSAMLVDGGNSITKN